MNQQPEESNTDPNQKPRPIDIFIEHVSAAGLQEAFGKKSERHQKYLFRLALILAAIGAAYGAHTVSLKYVFDQQRVFNDFDVIGKQMPFPNVTICGPETFKSSVIKKLITNNFNVTEYGYKEDDVIERSKALLSYSVREKPALTKLDREGLKALDKYISTKPNGVIDVYTEVYPTCQEMFNNCTYESTRFNCCDVAELLLFDERICYHFGLDKIQDKVSTSRIDEVNDPIHLDQSGFSINAVIDWPDVVYHDDLASDGFDIFIGALPSPWSNPIAIPADMDALIILAPPTTLSELSDCRAATHLPEMNYARYYDPYAVGCIGESLANSLLEHYGCILPGLNYMPKNASWLCTVEQLFGLVSIFDGEVFKNMHDQFETAVSSETMMRDIGQVAFQQCPQFCTRYLFDIISASYGSLKHINQSHTWSSPSDERSNVSWSRIRILFPTAVYEVHTETFVSPAYMALCEIGGLLGVYGGFSMVTVMEIFAYGVWLCFSSKGNQNRVGAVEEDD